MCRLAGLVAVLVLCQTLAGAEPSEARKPRDDADLRGWLENMVAHHCFTPEETSRATGLSAAEVQAALDRFGIRPGQRPARPAGSPLLALPYPGGRHPRLGFLDGAVRPQRETKVSIFTPWDPDSYVVADVPEAIWCQHGLLYLAHTHVPTLWTKLGVTLEPLEWSRAADGSLSIARRLPNKVTFATRVVPGRDGVRFEMTLTNNGTETLKDLRVQNCLMLKGARGFAQATSTNKLHVPPYAAARDESGKRWIIWAWEPNHRCWDNPPCPCLHSDPRFPDCEPGRTQKLRGWLSFHEGDDVRSEFRRLDQLGWREAGRAPGDSARPSRSRTEDP